jgi:hypothetical protein
VDGEKSLGSQVGSHETPMKLKHYLSLAPSGTWHFRQRVPADLIWTAQLFLWTILMAPLATSDLMAAGTFGEIAPRTNFR